jgi:hypothetical protein
MSNQHAHIDKYSMTGKGPHIHVIEDDISPNGTFNLAVDEKDKKIYWSDSVAGRIESILFSGKKRRIFNDEIRSPVSLTVVDNEIYWISSNSRNLYFASKEKIGSVKKIQVDSPPGLKTPPIISLATKVPLKISDHPCTKGNGGCSHICVSNGPTARTCLCPPSMSFKNNDNTTCRVAEACEFRCNSGECVALSAKCNNKTECQDGSDETGCDGKFSNSFVTCNWDQFKCVNGKQCIPMKSRCDMHFDCNDKSDERNCPTDRSSSQRCHSHQFECSDGRCIDLTSFCDGFPDCSKGEDENNCPKSNEGKSRCGPNMFRCYSGQCLPKTWECDGFYDCRDNTDEHEKCRK